MELTVRFLGPRHMTFRFSLSTGGYENRYTSTISLGSDSVSESMVDEHPNIMEAQLAAQSAHIRDRLRLSGQIRYSRLWRPGSSWTPRDEWSGELSADWRTVGSGHASLYLGTKVRLGSRSPSLVSDSSFDLHAAMLVR